MSFQCPICKTAFNLVPQQVIKKLTSTEIIDYAKAHLPIPATPEIIGKLTVQETPTEYHLKSPYFGKDEQGRASFGKFADALKQAGGKWHSDRDKKEWYFIFLR